MTLAYIVKYDQLGCPSPLMVTDCEEEPMFVDRGYELLDKKRQKRPADKCQV